jgi:hypothetical protein
MERDQIKWLISRWHDARGHNCRAHDEGQDCCLDGEELVDLLYLWWGK